MLCRAAPQPFFHKTTFVCLKSNAAFYLVLPGFSLVSLRPARHWIFSNDVSTPEPASLIFFSTPFLSQFSLKRSTRSGSSGLRYANGAADHQAPVGDENQQRGVELEGRPPGNDAERQVLQQPPVVQPVGHDGVDAEGRGDGRALEVLALARGVLG